MRFHLNLILTLAGKDWRLFWADKRAALLCFAVPLVLAAAFGAIFHRPENETTSTKLPMLVVIEDDGPFTARIVADLLKSPRLEARTATSAEAKAAIAERRPSVAVVLTLGFERLKSWSPGSAEARPELLILHHPAASAEQKWAEGVVTEVVMRNLAREKYGAFLGGNSAKGDDALPFALEVSPVIGEAAAFNSYSHSFCGMTVQYLLFWGMESGLLFLRERQRGVWKRTRAAPVPFGCVLAGKALATAAIAFLLVLVTFGFGYLAFGVTVTGSFVGFLLLAIAAGGLAAATGLLVAAIGGTEARARSVSVLVILGVSVIGGLWVPAFLLPTWVRDTALSLPTAWAMRGFTGVTWEGLELQAVLPSVGMVLAFALSFLTLAAWRLNRAEKHIREGNP